MMPQRSSWQGIGKLMVDRATLVHVRISDFETKQPTPVRIRFQCADGSTPAPLGRLRQFSLQRGQDQGGHLCLNGKNYFTIDGACEIPLLPGQLHVEVSKGPNYIPLDQTLVLAPGQISLRLMIHRQSDWRPRGWVSGDTRVLFLPPHSALLESMAEDVSVTNLLALEELSPIAQFSALPNLLAFSGIEPLLQSPNHLLAVNTLNIHRLRGSLSLLNSHRPVFPLRAGAVDELPEWSVLAWCEQCHRKNGLVVWPDLPRLTQDSPQTEALAAAILGKVDAWEISSNPISNWIELEPWYELLDSGLPIALVGGSGRDNSQIPIGNVRTYAHLGVDNPFTYASWIDAVRNSRSLATNGPFLELQVNANQPGSCLSPNTDSLADPVAIRVHSVEAGTIELLINHEVVVAGNHLIEKQILLETDSWIAARWKNFEGTCFSHTSPVWWKGTGKQPAIRFKSMLRLRNRLDQGQAWVHQSGLNGEKATDFDQVIQSAREKLNGQLAQVNNR